jgi:hypothetical protein
MTKDFAEMRMSSYNDYCFDCDAEGITPINWGHFKMLVGECLYNHCGMNMCGDILTPAEEEEDACLLAQILAFKRYHN